MRGEISSARFFRMGKSDWRKAFAPERTAMPCSMRKARIWLIVAVRLATSLGSDAVAGLQVELILRLLGHATQVRAQGRFRDGLGIVVVVLLPLHERLHVDGRNDPRLVGKREPLDLAAKRDRAISAEADEMEHVLADVEADGREGRHVRSCLGSHSAA